MQSVLYNYMDEFLFQFCTEGFVARRVSIVAFDKGAHFACFTGTKVQIQALWFVARRVCIAAFDKGAHFACFTGTKVRILTLRARLRCL
jgi:hypothetical protein